MTAAAGASAGILWRRLLCETEVQPFLVPRYTHLTAPYLKNSNQPAIEYIYAKFRSVYQPIPEVMTRSRVKYVGLIAAVSLLVALFLSAVVYSWTITPHGRLDLLFAIGT